MRVAIRLPCVAVAPDPPCLTIPSRWHSTSMPRPSRLPTMIATPSAIRNGVRLVRITCKHSTAISAGIVL